MLSDEQIIERVLQGRAGDYRELVVRYQSDLFRLAYRTLGRREDAEDAVQEALVKAYRKLADCRERGRFFGWVRRILVNTCLRRPACEARVGGSDDIAASAICDDDPVQEEVLSRAGLREIQGAVASLPADYRTVIVLRYGEELEFKEIAELLGEQPGAIYTRLHRARQMLSKKLEEASYEMC